MAWRAGHLPKLSTAKTQQRYRGNHRQHLLRSVGALIDLGDEHRARLSSIIESSDDAIISKDLNGIIRTWNRSAERLFGYSEADSVGQSITMLIPADRQHEEDMILSRVRSGRRVHHYETIRRRKDGSLIEVSISVSPVRSERGQIIGASKIVRDITERKHADATLRESEMRMRAILDSAIDAIITIDEAGTIESVNPATERLFGYPRADLIGRNVRMLMPEPYHSEHDGYIGNYLRTGQAQIIGISREVTALRKDRSTFPASLAVNVVPLAGRRLFTGIIHDLTDQRQLERQILEIVATEQRRIGQDLHDGVCQDLVGIAFQADGIARDLAAEGSAEDGEGVDRIAASIRAAAAQARGLSHGLNPVDLKGGGLPSALEGLAAKVAASFNIQCVLHWDGADVALDDATATHLYRISQEAITNAIKHGKAKNVRISLTGETSRLVLRILDDGTWLNPGSRSDGIGLKGMQYRANLVEGVLKIFRMPQGGTIVSCIVPIASKARRK